MDNNNVKILMAFAAALRDQLALTDHCGRGLVDLMTALHKCQQANGIGPDKVSARMLALGQTINRELHVIDQLMADELAPGNGGLDDLLARPEAR